MEIDVKPQSVRRVGVVGTGVIGSAWAAWFLARGLDVSATDPNPGSEMKLRDIIARAWPFLKQLGLAEDASPDRLTFSTSMVECLNDVDFVQESTPEKEAVKDTVIAAISEIVRADVVIASSTSGIVPSRLQVKCKYPERMIVGHPFNPVYLIPLVEVVGGEKTAPETIGWAMEFYRHIGKMPLHCKVEKEGHLANRLQDAVFGEMLHLIADGVASVTDLDAALTAGPGMRWALIGSFVTGYMATGGAGMREIFNGKFGGAMSYMACPNLDQQAVDMIVANAEKQVANRSLEFMEQMRDEFLVGVLKLRADIAEKYGFDSGHFISCL